MATYPRAGGTRLVGAITNLTPLSREESQMNLPQTGVTQLQAGRGSASDIDNAVVRAEHEQIAGFDVRFNDRANFDVLCKDLFDGHIYHFDSPADAPRILDCGGNIGMSCLYFKSVYPGARITTFEPDPRVLPYLRHNLRANEFDDIEVVEAALATSAAPQVLHSDGKYASSLSDHAADDVRSGADAEFEVPCVQLADYIGDRTHFMKMNIEGAEWPVLQHAGDALRRIDQMVIEYHHLPGLPRTLHKILALLDDLGFEYLINDFDRVTNPHAHPPFRLTARTAYYLLIFAKRTDAQTREVGSKVR